jgi:acyl-coenzyme A thioesterase PaaI-like protein
MTVGRPRLAVPPDYPDPAAGTGNRRLLAAIVSGAAPPPPCVTRFALPRPGAWSPGTLTGTVRPTETETWAPGVVFGGYLACLVDQFAGLVMLSVLPDGATFLTAGMTLDLHAPMCPGEATISARVVRLAVREATVEVALDQSGRAVCRATVRQVVRRSAARLAGPDGGAVGGAG